MYKLQIILLEEGEFTDPNYDLMQSALEYQNTYLKDKNGELFLTVNFLKFKELNFERCKCKT